jgi:hypothetical protein
MLYQIRSLTDSFFSLLNQDPVRPHIPHTQRFGDSKDIFVLRDDENKAKAITCVSYQQSIPTSESELFLDGQADTAVFYTIWSYVSGAASELLFDTVQAIQEQFPTVTRFVTLSPKTDMARKFHIRNGAHVLRENTDTVNYEYVIGG